MCVCIYVDSFTNRDKQLNIQNTLGREFQVYRGEGRVSGLCGAALKVSSRACALSIRGLDAS